MSDVLLLVAEDEAVLRLMLDDSLQEAGFKTLLAANGAKALEYLNADAARFSGVLTDIRLGNGPNGWEVAHRARELVPSMAIVYMSGDSKDDWAAQGVPNSMLIEKPFANAQIITAISQLLNAR